MPLLAFCAALILAQAAAGQTMVSARSGLISFLQDEVMVDNIEIAFAPSNLQHLQQGEHLQTAMGRAEVLLTPGVFLWLGEQGDLEMVRSDILDVQVRLRSGTLYVQVRKRPAKGKISLLAGDAEIAFPRRGLYRLDALPSGPQSLQVFAGQAVVSIQGKEIKVSSKRSLQFQLAAADRNQPPKLDHTRQDSFDEWTAARISAVDKDELRAQKSARKKQDDGFWIDPFPGRPQSAPQWSRFKTPFAQREKFGSQTTSTASRLLKNASKGEASKAGPPGCDRIYANHKPIDPEWRAGNASGCNRGPTVRFSPQRDQEFERTGVLLN